MEVKVVFSPEQIDQIETCVSLTTKLSDMIDRALDDMEKVEKLEGYSIDMGNWYATENDGCCTVCLAGSVLVGCVPKDIEYVLPQFFSVKLANQMYALNALRGGAVSYAARKLQEWNKYSHHDLLVLSDLNCDNVTQYWRDPAQFKQEMRALAGRIRAAGY